MAAALAVTPAEGAYRLVCAVVLGMALGIGYDFLRPLGVKHPHVADLLFAPLAFWGWLYESFAVCQCDIRMVYTLGMFGGLLLWEVTAARWLQPVCFFLCGQMTAISRHLLIPWKNFLKFVKIMFASAKKWVTIVRTKVFKSGKKRRKESHGKRHYSPQKSESGNSSRIQFS